MMPSNQTSRYPSELSKVMSIVHRAISTYIVQRAGFSNQQGVLGTFRPLKT